ncbi:WecB/TagA/CpsF family glycosyltransferase [Pseudarthrobacter sp. L1SW]|uniref:WecB/TagA/CpsF family glycosyltransferase n=1 Tax=Pseudarthrobacter sp. L1SW TaxID=2851598 RepID=UPI001E286771|nr:WecB/TagA/CpsF family glycosyltransferase [Pseudarthrobacter sp. L1SW]UEL27784.1 WecB/TagA/CpsF family glycosyltransferase [Pseudarthrobacter sp. L1SW]
MGTELEADVTPIAVVGGVPFAVTTLDEAALSTLAMASGKIKPQCIRLANAYSVVLANSDPAYSDLLMRTGRNYPDGAPIVSCMKWFAGYTHAGRVRGPSFFRRTIEFGLPQNTRHFFLGTTADTLRKLEERLREQYPSIQIAGSYAPSFSPLNSTLIAECVQALGNKDIDIVWVGLGTPKQDFIAREIVASLGIPAAGVGAAFDFAAGTVREAPSWVQRIGAEWFFRLLSDPKRLWKRYFFGNTEFVWVISRTVVSAMVRKAIEGGFSPRSKSGNP